MQNFDLEVSNVKLPGKELLMELGSGFAHWICELPNNRHAVETANRTHPDR